MENHHFSWENSLFQWPFSIAFCMFTSWETFPDKPLDSNLECQHSALQELYHARAFRHGVATAKDGIFATAMPGIYWKGKVNHLRRCQNLKKTRTSYVVPICTLCMDLSGLWTWKLGGAAFDWVNIQPHQLWDWHGSVWKWGWEYLKTAAKHGESDDHNRDIMVVQIGTK